MQDDFEQEFVTKQQFPKSSNVLKLVSGTIAKKLWLSKFNKN